MLIEMHILRGLAILKMREFIVYLGPFAVVQIRHPASAQTTRR